jgi:hypothetical protein
MRVGLSELCLCDVRLSVMKYLMLDIKMNIGHMLYCSIRSILKNYRQLQLPPKTWKTKYLLYNISDIFIHYTFEVQSQWITIRGWELSEHWRLFSRPRKNDVIHGLPRLTLGRPLKCVSSIVLLWTNTWYVRYSLMSLEPCTVSSNQRCTSGLGGHCRFQDLC